MNNQETIIREVESYMESLIPIHSFDGGMRVHFNKEQLIAHLKSIDISLSDQEIDHVLTAMENRKIIGSVGPQKSLSYFKK